MASSARCLGCRRTTFCPIIKYSGERQKPEKQLHVIVKLLPYTLYLFFLFLKEHVGHYVNGSGSLPGVPVRCRRNILIVPGIQ